ncbi:hypothetical protein K3495_g8242 [Podosphaera aphanis]|nr:hypothetical protein K3495_g8242 [Podosphaera aphanis]
MEGQTWITKLHNASSISEQIIILKSLKYTITGHPLVKEFVVTRGTLDSITKLAYNKPGVKKDDLSSNLSQDSRSLNEDELSRLLALQIIASIALEGPRFVAPLHSSGVLPALLSNICPENNPLLLVLASLKALSNLSDSSALIKSPRALTVFAIADDVFTRKHLKSLCTILSQESASNDVQSQISITASLISKICREEHHQQILANFGVLDVLATRLAGFVVGAGLVIPGAEVLAARDNLVDHIPKPAPPNADFALIADAIFTIIANSKLRCSQLIFSSSILTIFPVSKPTELNFIHNRQPAWNNFNLLDPDGNQAQFNWMDCLLPHIPQPQSKLSSSGGSAFPPLGTTGSTENLNLNRRSSINKHKAPLNPSWEELKGLESDSNQADLKIDHGDLESPLISYLMLFIRSRSGLDRLMASAVLASLYRAGLTHKKREIEIGFMIVPLLIQMLDKSFVSPLGREESDQQLHSSVKETVPLILAMLMTDSEHLQKAAFTAGIVHRLSLLLKSSYEHISDAINTVPWSPFPESEQNHKNKFVRLGNDGQSPLLVHKIKVRESSLKAIAALVPFKDEYRKNVVDQGLIPLIVESLLPQSKKLSSKILEEKSTSLTVELSDSIAKRGCDRNPSNVLIAACAAVRALSRSVSVLRTTLIDNGVAEPVFQLLLHPEIEVQIAATATVINLLTDVSPMRDTIAKAGVLKILCDHAKSRDARLRLNAVWALKHFVQGVDNEMKRQCFEELGQGWLVHLICDDTEDVALLSKDKLGSLSPSTNDIDGDIEMTPSEDQNSIMLSNFNNHKNCDKSSFSRNISVKHAKLRLMALRDSEMDPARKARKDDVAVQEQGLDFIRNLIGGVGQGGTEASDMIDFLLDALGQERVFEILASKLRPKAINPYNRKTPRSGESKVIPPQTEIIIAVSYILVHMAASIPRHRQLIIAQTELLKLLVPQFNHSNVEVRLALCWLVTNLTWMDDQTDEQSCAHRASELRKLGFLAKLEMLEHDSELSVRDRAKSALWQMQQSC